MGKTISMKLLFGIYLLLMAGKVFAFSCNVDGGSSIGAGTTSVYVNLDPVIQPGQNLVVDLSQHISCWNDYGGWYDTDHINLVQGSAFAGSLQSYKGSLYWNNVTYPFPLTTNTKEGANKRGNSSRLTQSFHFFMFEPIFSPVNALNQPI